MTGSWTYVPDASMRRYGRTFVGGSPTRMLRLGTTGQRVLERVLHHHSFATPQSKPHTAPELQPEEQRLINRFVQAGMLHPVPSVDVAPQTVSVVIPVKDRRASLRQLLAHLSTDMAHHGAIQEVIIVDDGSQTPYTIDDLAGLDLRVEIINKVRIVRHDVSLGPGAARTAGAEQARSDLIAFIDSDCLVTSQTLAALSKYFDHDDVVLVAPRVLAADLPKRENHTSSSARKLFHYETEFSPLDLGSAPASISAGTRVSYVPAAMLMIRRHAFMQLNGFNPDLRVGEDVDFLWRLEDHADRDAASGWGLRYTPEITVYHAVRDSWLSWAKQRFMYGTSAAPLDHRHPHKAAPVVITTASLEAAAMTVATLRTLRYPRLGNLLLTAGLVRIGHQSWQLHQQLNRSAVTPETLLPPWVATRLVITGHSAAISQLLTATLRTWWPIALLLSLFSKTARQLFAVSAIWSWWKHAHSQTSTHSHAQTSTINPGNGLIGIADDVIYGAGVWAGCFKQRSWRVIVPVVKRSR